jgi:hypothetical protein
MRLDPSAPSLRIAALAVALAAAACAPLPSAPPDAGVDEPPPPDAGEPAASALEVVGTWADNWGGETEISAQQWGSSTLLEYDNAANWAVTQYPADDPWSGGKFAKQVWTEPAGGAWWLCTIEYAAESAQAAENTDKIADASDPAEGGCGGFAWTRMQVPLEVRGAWVDGFGFDHEFSSVSWDGARLAKYDNAANVAIAQFPASDPWNPLKYSKQVWTELADGSFWQCTVAFSAETQAAAESAPDADASDPANGGCGGFGWSRMTPAFELRGQWDLGGEEAVTITSSAWGALAVARFDNAANVAVVQYPPGHETLGGRFARHTWTERSATDTFHLCVTGQGAESADAAAAATELADPSNLATGCRGEAWTAAKKAVL